MIEGVKGNEERLKKKYINFFEVKRHIGEQTV